jgi:hypothetical protein
MTPDELKTALVALWDAVRIETDKKSGDKDWDKLISRADMLAEEAAKVGHDVFVVRFWQMASCAALVKGDTRLAVDYAERMMRLRPSEVFEGHLEICRESDALRRKLRDKT